MVLTKVRLGIAFGVAALADLLQIFLFPLFIEGALSPLNDVVDVAVGGSLTLLLGWHWVFLPSFAAELVPGLDLAPTWLAAVGWVALTRKKELAGAPQAAEKPAVPAAKENASLPPPQ